MHTGDWLILQVCRRMLNELQKKVPQEQKIGFDSQINDDDGSGKRDPIVKWNNPTGESYRKTIYIVGYVDG